tara:strand:- start:357 stop:1397 length:1041 start_codon:yes stop_codon:yes gene_type:complete
MSMMIFMAGCLYPTNEWEDLESDFSHVLNVFGLINLDPGYPSYVGLYRTTDLNETSMNFVSADTLYWCDCSEDDCSWYCDEDEQGFWVIDSIYEPAALIKDASVNLTDESGNTYNLAFVEKISFIDTIYFDTSVTIYGTTVNWDTTFYDTNDIRINFYIDTSGAFNPQPSTRYEVNISAPGYEPVTGSLTTPTFPNIDSLVQRNIKVDTITASEPFDIYWDHQSEGKGFITGEVISRNWFEDSISSDCGYFDPFIIDFSDVDENPTSVFPWICNETLESFPVRDYFIRLTSMDENYYEYFILGESGEYSNALLNYPTTKGRSVGIEGGFGFFGSIASDGLLLKISP